MPKVQERGVAESKESQKRRKWKSVKFYKSSDIFQWYTQRGLVFSEEKFWNNVRKTDTCWFWTRCLDKNGYGKVSVMGGPVCAHWVSFVLNNQCIKDEMTVAHTCSNRNCVNPVHLILATRKENVLKGDSPVSQNCKKEVCKRGHPLSGSNLILCRDGSRQCNLCRKLKNSHEWKEKKRISQYHKEYYQKHRKEALAYAREHKDQRTEYMQKWRTKNRSRWIAYVRARNKKYRKEQNEYARKRHQKQYAQLKHEILEKLGSKCQKCGYPDIRCLDIDHIEGGGNIHRKKIGVGVGYLKDILKGIEKNQYRLLCKNCNWLAYLKTRNREH
jgi:hypothetical protein